MAELRVGDIRKQIEGLPDDAPAFVDVCGFDVGIHGAVGGAAIIDPPDAERGEDGRWPTRPGLELWAGPDPTAGAEERERLAERVAQALCIDRRHPLEAARTLAMLRADWPVRVEQARSLTARLEGELAEIRRAVEGIHAPKAVAGEDPEDPTIICATCRTDFPCETRSFLDVIGNPLVADTDEFARQPEPF